MGKININNGVKWELFFLLFLIMSKEINFYFQPFLFFKVLPNFIKMYHFNHKCPLSKVSKHKNFEGTLSGCEHLFLEWSLIAVGFEAVIESEPNLPFSCYRWRPTDQFHEMLWVLKLCKGLPLLVLTIATRKWWGHAADYRNLKESRLTKCWN